jgi:hypothetical protein
MKCRDTPCGCPVAGILLAVHECNLMVVLKNTAHFARYLRGIFDKKKKYDI